MKLISCVLLPILFAATAAAQTPFLEQAEALAAELEAFGSASLTYRRTDGARKLALPAGLVALLGTEATDAEKLALLEHADSRVRSLGVALAYDCESPRMLAALARLLDDDGAGIPSLDEPFFHSETQGFEQAFNDPFFDLDVEPRTVGSLVMCLLRFHTGAAGRRMESKLPVAKYGQRGTSIRARWTQLSNTRGSAQLTFGAARVRLIRLSQGRSEFDSRQTEAGLVLLKDILGLPPMHAASLLLRLDEVNGDGSLLALAIAYGARSTEHLIEDVVQRIGPYDLRVLFDDASSALSLTDPDCGPWALQSYLLSRAGKELGKEDFQLLEYWIEHTTVRREEHGQAAIAPIEGTRALGKLESEERRLARYRKELDGWLALNLECYLREGDRESLSGLYDEEIRESRSALAEVLVLHMQDDADLQRLVRFVMLDPAPPVYAGSTPHGTLDWLRRAEPEALHALLPHLIAHKHFARLGQRTTWVLAQAVDQHTTEEHIGEFERSRIESELHWIDDDLPNRQTAEWQARMRKALESGALKLRDR